jgi:N-acetylglucosamine-6-phosphate deacetylase
MRGSTSTANRTRVRILLALCERLRSDGVDRILATVITAPLPQMIARVNRVAAMIDAEPEIARTIAGIHIEGPFISPVTGYVGAHPVDSVQPASISVAEQLLHAGLGHVKLLTLAPEHDDQARVTRWLASQDIRVAAGHSNATIDCLNQSIDAGLSLYTHLGNGCPPALPRHDNIIQRVLSLSDNLSISFIADGHHVPPFALKNYLLLVPSERVIIVTDAISAAGLGPGRYQLGDQTVEVDEEGAAWSSDKTHFAGSAATMNRMVDVLRSMDITDDQIDQWTRQNPRSLLMT